MGSGSTRRFRRVYMRINIERPIGERYVTHIVENLIQITSKDI